MDEKRAESFRKELEALQAKVSFSAEWNSISDLVLDFYNSNPGANSSELRRYFGKIVPERTAQLELSVFRRMDEIRDLANTFYSDLGDQVTRDLPLIKRVEDLAKLKLGDYERETIKDMVKITKQSLAQKLPIKEFSGKLKKLGGKVNTYADSIAITQVKSMGRAAKAEKANSALVFDYQVIGVLRSTSRQFCIDTVGKHFHIDEINKLDNGAGQPKPVLIYWGGWRCHHEAEPDPFYKKKNFFVPGGSIFGI